MADKKLTPMMELIEYIELCQPKNKVTDGIWAKANSLLEKERQNYINAYESGAFQTDGNGTEYYNETFKTK